MQQDNIILALSEEEHDRLKKLEIALAFHDITVFPDRTLDYLESSYEIARKYLLAIGREEWIKKITLMLGNLHQITKYLGEYANLVEAFRQSDWIDVSFSQLRFGLSKAWIKELHRQLPLFTLYPKILLSVIARYVVGHLSNPMPNFRF